MAVAADVCECGRLAVVEIDGVEPLLVRLEDRDLGPAPCNEGVGIGGCAAGNEARVVEIDPPVWYSAVVGWGLVVYIETE